MKPERQFTPASKSEEASGVEGPTSATHACGHSSSSRGNVLFTRADAVMKTASMVGRRNSAAESG